MPQVEIPGKVVDASGEDLLVPLQRMLTGINVLGSSSDATGGAFQSPPQSVAIIESGATALTKWWSGAIAALGGTTAIAAAATRFWNGQQGGSRIALLATTGAVIAAVILALAWIVSSDVRGRASGACCIYEARSGVAQKFLDVALAASSQASGGADAGSHGASAAAAVSESAAAATLHDLVASAAESAVAPVNEGISSLQQSIASIDKSTALVVLAALQQERLAPPPTITVDRTDTGLTGTLNRIFVSSSGDANSDVQVSVIDAAGASIGIPLNKVQEFH